MHATEVIAHINRRFGTSYKIAGRYQAGEIVPHRCGTISPNKRPNAS
jgi:hypothetical protein